MNNQEVYFAKVKSGATIPTKRKEDAGIDLYACFEEESMILPPCTTTLVPTGIASAFSSDYMFLLEERGSTAVKSMKKGAGVIDSGYRDEWFVCLYNGNNKPIIITKATNKLTLEGLKKDYIVYPYTKGIAQALFLPVLDMKSTEKTYEEILAIGSERGLGKLGDSGK